MEVCVHQDSLTLLRLTEYAAAIDYGRCNRIRFRNFRRARAWARKAEEMDRIGANVAEELSNFFAPPERNDFRAIRFEILSADAMEAISAMKLSKRLERIVNENMMSEQEAESVNWNSQTWLAHELGEIWLDKEEPVKKAVVGPIVAGTETAPKKKRVRRSRNEIRLAKLKKGIQVNDIIQESGKINPSMEEPLEKAVVEPVDKVTKTTLKNKRVKKGREDRRLAHLMRQMQVTDTMKE